MYDGHFLKQDFDLFNIEGLKPRMDALKTRLQPKLESLGQIITEELQQHVNHPLYTHVAKHQRRTVNPPIDSWFAVSPNKRGYKKHPHFEVGLFNDRVFIYFALMHNLPDKPKLGDHLLSHQELFDRLDEHYVYSLDHYEKEAMSIDTLTNKELAYFRDTKKVDFLIGKQLMKEEVIHMTNNSFESFVIDTFVRLLPFYQEAHVSQIK